jgi:hypothetical protein
MVCLGRQLIKLKLDEGKKTLRNLLGVSDVVTEYVQSSFALLIMCVLFSISLPQHVKKEVLQCRPAL